jgi:hypothetical protein
MLFRGGVKNAAKGNECRWGAVKKDGITGTRKG